MSIPTRCGPWISIRRHGRLPQTQVHERERRVQPTLLAIRAGRRCKSQDVVGVLEKFNSIEPTQVFIGSANGPECIARAL